MSFSGILRQSTAVDVLIGPFVDSTDGDAEEAALTINRADVLLSKNGQGGVQKTDVTAAAHDADGMYNCELDATDTDTTGQLTLWVHVAGALLVRHDYQIVEESTYDFLYAAGATPLADINAEVDTGLTDYDAPTKAEMDTAHGLLATEAKQDIIDTNVDDIETAVITNAAGVDIAADIIAIKAETVLIVADTGELQADDYPTSIAAIQTTVDVIEADLANGVDGLGALKTLIDALNDVSLANITTEIADSLRTDTLTATPQGAPSTTPTIMQAVMTIYDALVHKIDIDSGFKEFYNNAGTVIWKKALSDDASNYVEAESETGP